MVTLENLYDIADNEGIDIIPHTFSKTKKAACMCTPIGKNILLDKSHIGTAAEEKVILSEELSHYETNAFYTIRDNLNSRTARCNRLRQEAKAQKHSYIRMIPPEELQAFTKKTKPINLYDIAEYFGVTVRFLEEAMTYYRTKGMMLPNEERLGGRKYGEM